MEYELGIRLDKMEADMMDIKQRVYILYKLFEKSSPKFNEVLSDLRKNQLQEPTE